MTLFDECHSVRFIITCSKAARFEAFGPNLLPEEFCSIYIQQTVGPLLTGTAQIQTGLKEGAE